MHRVVGYICSNMRCRAMNLAWMAVEAKRIEFEKMVFTTENIWDRQEQRMELYKVFDRAVDVCDILLVCDM